MAQGQVLKGLEKGMVDGGFFFFVVVHKEDLNNQNLYFSNLTALIFCSWSEVSTRGWCAGPLPLVDRAEGEPVMISLRLEF